jgi:Transposase DDE domain group 1
MTMDLDSTVCEVHGDHKQGAAYGSTRTLGYHPLVASRADSGEVLHARQRTGRANTARGTARFVDELAARVRRAGASGELTMRMDSGFWSAKTIRACRRHRLRYSITVRQTTPIRAAIATIDEQAWVDIVYPEDDLAQVAETRYQGDRLLVRRTRLVGEQAELFPDYRLPRRLDHASSTHPQPLPAGPHDRTSPPRIPASVDPGSGQRPQPPAPADRSLR